MFSVLLICFLAIKYVLRFIIPDTPEVAVTINKRHKVVVDRVIKGFKGSTTKMYKTAPFNFNIGGVVYNYNQEGEDLLRQYKAKEQNQASIDIPQQNL